MFIRAGSNKEQFKNQKSSMDIRYSYGGIGYKGVAGAQNQQRRSRITGEARITRPTGANDSEAISATNGSKGTSNY